MKQDVEMHPAMDGEKTVGTSAEPIDRVGRQLRIVSKILLSLESQIIEASLILVTGVARTTPRAIGMKIVVGRGSSADWCINDRSMSRHHFEVVQTRLGCLLRDLQSHNGTRVNDARYSERWLVDGDMICAGKQVFLFLERMEDQDA